MSIELNLCILDLVQIVIWPHAIQLLEICDSPMLPTLILAVGHVGNLLTRCEILRVNVKVHLILKHDIDLLLELIDSCKALHVL